MLVNYESAFRRALLSSREGYFKPPWEVGRLALLLKPSFV